MSDRPVASVDASNEPNLLDISDLDLADRITIGEQIAWGGFSSISKGTLLVDGSSIEVAIKELRVQGPTTIQTVKERLRKHFYREILLWRVLKHSNVVPLLGFKILPNESQTLVSPWYINGNITDYLAFNSSANRHALASNVVNGLEYLHSIPIAHGDLKGVNVLVDVNGQASLCDFGMSQFIDDANRIVGFTTTNANMGGTDRFMCPELLEDMPKTAATDMWALGCLVIQILTDVIPYRHITRKQAVLTAIMRGDQPVADGDIDIDIFMWGCIKKCWSVAQEERPSANELGLHLTRSNTYEPGAYIVPAEHITASLERLGRSAISRITCYSEPRVKFSPDGKYLAVADGGTVEIWEAEKNVLSSLKNWILDNPSPWAGGILSVTWSTSQYYLLVQSTSVTYVFVAETGKFVAGIEDCKWAAFLPAFDAVGFLDQKGTITIMDLARVDNILLTATLTPQTDDIKQIVFCPNNRHILTLTPTSISIYNLNTAKVVANTLHSGATEHISLSKDGLSVLVSGSRQAPELWGIDPSVPVIDLSLIHQYRYRLPQDQDLRSTGLAPAQFGGMSDQLILGFLGSGKFHIWDRNTTQLIHLFSWFGTMVYDTSIIWNSTDPEDIKLAMITLHHFTDSGHLHIWSAQQNTLSVPDTPSVLPVPLDMVIDQRYPQPRTSRSLLGHSKGSRGMRLIETIDGPEWIEEK